jgi:hypothetical protein
MSEIAPNLWRLKTLNSVWTKKQNNLLYITKSLTLSQDLKGKSILVKDHEVPWGCEPSKLPHFIENRLRDGGKVICLTHRPPFTPRNSSYSFLLEAESTWGLYCGWKLDQVKNPMTSSGIETATSGMWHSASTNYAAMCRSMIWRCRLIQILFD